MTFVPLFVDVEGMRVVVFGGGSVGTRRALMFASAGASVVVVADSFTQELEVSARAGKVELVRRRLSPGDPIDDLLRRANLVVVATSDPELNHYVASQALARGLLVNNATEAGEGNVVVPFSAEPIEGLHLAVTTLGLSGVAARWARDRASRCLAEDRELATLLRVMSKFKAALKASIKDPKVRVPLYFKVESDPVFRDLVARGDEEGALRRALEVAGLEEGGQ